ncbi:shikimate dehydrogenase [Sporosarcina gallistercoris]|uniref:Shikimate dehydrogenase (NADP(+)) n=1 Tax=Sporosarcina gallistercoris TaxID=2762245 RepID=A0ABR8PFG7_9BACL|nr:shikimate dehydrogenase [Sporosarcina gallistercoris]MBD7906888.1 shikimate dehydrogenase [Sporosarcina gallistercoris]
MKKWFAVIGDPVAQSMSPGMHDYWLQENGIDAAYLPIHAKSENLQSVITSLKLLGCSGWNVTVPHKSDILPFLGSVDDAAAHMDAVNTVVIEEEGSLVGYNTDGIGFVRALEEKYGKTRKEEEILIIGAGGAAKGIAFALRSAGYGPITFTNRTMANAEELSERLPNSTCLTIAEAEQQLSRFGIIIQTTSVGMAFSSEGMPLNPINVSPGTAAIDIIYNPLETEFLATARKKGADPANGIGMFVHQGALSFEKWTGIRPDTVGMMEQLTQQLEDQHANK